MSEEKKPVSVREFKAMIAGIDIMGGEKFTPNAEQWKRIRDMIDRLEEEQPVPVPVQTTQSYQPPAVAPAPPQQPAQPAGAPAVANPNNPLENDNAEFVVPAPSGGVPPGPVTRGASTSSLAPVAAPPKAPPPMQGEGTRENPVKTPDIDTSGGYNSTFL